MTNTDNQNFEEKWYKFWEENGLFKSDPNSSKPPYSLLMPPPNLTGELHLGHAMQHSILDAIARFKRMQGFDVLLLPGVDHAGIQFEGTLNKILAKEGLFKEKLGREEWLKRAWQFKEEIYKSFHNTWTVFGLSADWSKEVFTLDPKVQNAVFQQFKKFWEEGLLYKGTYIVQWCPRCGTAIEDVEMEYQEKVEKLYYVKYQIEDTVEYIVVATARPETIFADTGIAVYPAHPRFGKFVGKNAVNPLTDEKIPIFPDDRVDREFGTGALKITPGHDLLDYQIGQDHQLPILHAIDKTGKMTDLAQEFAGLKVEEARQKVVEKLQENGAIEKFENYTHAVPVCERCKTTVEPLISEEWFVKMTALAQKALQNLPDINFIPKNYEKILSDWYVGIHDWSISRNLWWGIRMPVWYCAKCNPNQQATKDSSITISMEYPKQECKTCGQSHEWIQDEHVLDTWFSSGLWPLATLGWPNKTKELDRYYPWDFEISAPEIKYLWIARMIMLGLWFADKIPFKNMFFHGMLRDLQGRKFSKSLGNGIDPNELRNQWGTDATRMALYSYAAPGRDARTSRQLMDERAKNYRNFGTKLKNITRFTIDLKPEGAKGLSEIDFDPKSLTHEDDKWIIDQLNKTINETTKHLENFNLHLAIEILYEFVWHQFADVYIEKSKTRRADTQPVLEYVLKTSLELLHPFMPFLTEELWQKLPHKEKSIMFATWPNQKE